MRVLLSLCALNAQEDLKLAFCPRGQGSPLIGWARGASSRHSWLPITDVTHDHCLSLSLLLSCPPCSSTGVFIAMTVTGVEGFPGTSSPTRLESLELPPEKDVFEKSVSAQATVVTVEPRREVATREVEVDMTDCPDGGFRAWLVVVGVSSRWIGSYPPFTSLVRRQSVACARLSALSTHGE